MPPEQLGTRFLQLALSIIAFRLDDQPVVVAPEPGLGFVGGGIPLARVHAFQAVNQQAAEAVLIGKAKLARSRQGVFTAV